MYVRPPSEFHRLAMLVGITASVAGLTLAYLFGL